MITIVTGEFTLTSTVMEVFTLIAILLGSLVDSVNAHYIGG